MRPADRRKVATGERYILITHSTDTMIVTASNWEDQRKVIVLTGAMQLAARVQSDAVNMGGAI
jgi:L-asparaginase/Glu-tRNA(Gln) amidotransferase subunit D